MRQAPAGPALCPPGASTESRAEGGQEGWGCAQDTQVWSPLAPPSDSWQRTGAPGPSGSAGHLRSGQGWPNPHPMVASGQCLQGLWGRLWGSSLGVGDRGGAGPPSAQLQKSRA